MYYYYSILFIYKIVNTQIGGLSVHSNIIKNIITKNINKFVKNPNKSFKFYKLNYSKEEKASIKNIKIDKNYTLDFYGSSSSLDMNKVADFFMKIGNNRINNCNNISNIIKKLCVEVCNGFEQNKTSCWLTIRVSLPNNFYEIPIKIYPPKIFIFYLSISIHYLPISIPSFLIIQITMTSM